MEVKVKSIAYSYYRSIRNGNRTYESIPESVKEDVLTLLESDEENEVVLEEVVDMKQALDILGVVNK